MKGSKYILGRLKEKFEVGDKYETEGFPDLNYTVGNTSGLDVGQVPSPLDQRIGNLAQRGGSVMEVMVRNPGTFQIDKQEILPVIQQLGIDISIHSDPNVSFTSAYRSQSQGGVGYEPAHNYFSDYLQEFAIFKTEVEKRKDLTFEISRINPHISTSMLPSLDQRAPADTGLDPFGFTMGEITKESFKERNKRGQNIFKNKEFLKKMYNLFLVEEFSFEYQYFSAYSNFSDRFEDEWSEARKEVLNSLFDEDTGGPDNGKVEDKVAIVRTAGAQDPGSSTKWLNVLEKIKLEESVSVGGRDIETLKDAANFLESIQIRLSRLQRLPEAYYSLKKDFEDVVQNAPGTFDDDSLWELRDAIIEETDDGEIKLEKALDMFWEGFEETEAQTITGSFDKRKYYISVDAQTQAISNRLEIPGRRIDKEAYLDNEDDLDKYAENVFAGEDEFFESKDDYFRLFRDFVMNFQQQMWMESNLFYRIIPAWMTSASISVEEADDEDEMREVHSGWESPEFIWKTLVKEKWEDKDRVNGNYEIDVSRPNESDYFDLLENKREFMMDVAAASAACYVWGHFTQKKSSFDINREKYVDNDMGDYTWIDWMNRYGIGINLEAMPGSPQQMYKIWRPKDIVVAARAVNITARNKAKNGELEPPMEIEKEDGDVLYSDARGIHPKLDGRPVKFTADLEHTATFGVDPWKEMEDLIEQERKLVDTGLSDEHELDIDTEKPLAKIFRMWHLMKPGLETSQAETRHGPWAKGDTDLYETLWKMVADGGFARNPDEAASLMYEVGGEQKGTVNTTRIAMNLIELGVSPKELDPSKVNPGKEYRNEKEELMAKFFNMDRESYSMEWAHIEQHAFDPLDGLLETTGFSDTYSGTAALQNDNRITDFLPEEYR